MKMVEEGGQEWPRKGTAILPPSSVSYRLSSPAKAGWGGLAVVFINSLVINAPECIAESLEEGLAASTVQTSSVNNTANSKCLLTANAKSAETKSLLPLTVSTAIRRAFDFLPHLLLL